MFLDCINRLFHQNSSPTASKVVMLHIGRCGSTVVAKLLEQHRNIYWANELYEPIFKQWDRLNPGFTVAENMPIPPIEFLKLSIPKACAKTYGFEIKPYHFRLMNISFEEFIEKIEMLGFQHFILLDRKNKLRKIISSIKAKKSGVYHLQKGSTPNFQKIKIPLDNIEIDHESKSLLKFIDDYINDMDAINDILKNKNILKLNYEDDIEKNPINAYEKICDFIGVKKIKPTISLSKTTPFPVRDLIENYDDVVNCLNCSSHGWMLEG
jgi:hypothetical protein